MALDQEQYHSQKMRNNILRNIGHAFVKMGQYADAISSFEHVLDQRSVLCCTGAGLCESGSHQTANLECVECVCSG
jgi:hypothetical protein